MNWLEVLANALNTVSILLAARNSAHTWWVGILGCAAFAQVFFATQLYADALLQLFFIATSIIGWRTWISRANGLDFPVRKTDLFSMCFLTMLALVVSVAYGTLLHAFTNAFAPYWDSAVLAFSVLGQLLLMQRRYESWWCWIIVNSIAVPLFASRGLYITSGLYLLYWVNAIVALISWRKHVANQ